MAAKLETISGATRFRIAHATVPSCLLEGTPALLLGEVALNGLTAADLIIADGRIERILPPGTDGEDLPVLDLDHGMAWPTFVDMHTHLDKGHISPRKPNPDGSFMGALEAVGADRAARWTAEDVAGRMDFALRSAYAHGTSLIRTHIDSIPPQHTISWPVFDYMRERWAGRIDLQAVALFPLDFFGDDAFADDIVATVTRYGGVLGSFTQVLPEGDTSLDRLMQRATEAGLDIDLHVDETREPQSRSLRAIAEAALRNRFEGRIVVGHCCSLAQQPEDEADRTMDLVAEAGLSVVSLPMCNMYLQDRQTGRTPRWRGVTLLHEMKARGISVSVASDNTRDPFYAYGDLDAVEVFREAVRIGQLDHPVGDWANAVTRTPADALGRADHGRLAEGAPADLVLFPARNWSEFLSRPQSGRIVLRNGEAIDRTLPDYRELDRFVSLA
ncbi:cytosine deaminase [Faunimonas pinastri]|uniref:Cytosine deaminase n=1 Tax=Faunimonas pinastri TaxID=1855383 RepID=A0A1H9MHQ9_9HYPH|nr:cytosine deaminase [Faunimonas pinastri]SER23234.1 cytosine deaminase [Faunimonas pinastri]